MNEIAREKSVILVADDDESTRLVLRGFLENDGYTVFEATDGAQALSNFERLRPDLVILDAMMPVMDGFTTCARIRNLPGGGQAPVLMLTGLKDHKSLDLAFDAGATDFITKPILWKELGRRVRYLLRARQAELLLGQSMVSAQSIISSALDGIIIVDSGNLINSFNPAAERIFGYPGADVVGRNVKLLMPGAIRDRDTSDQDSAGEDSTFSASREVTGLRKGGREFPIELAISGYSSGDKLLIVRDISERKQAEEKLYLMAKVFENVTEGIVVIGADGAVQSVNPAFTKITGYDEAEVTGKFPEFWGECKQKEECYQELLPVIEEKGVWQEETWLMRKDGEKAPVWLRVTAIKDNQGNNIQLVCVFTDISEQVKMREERRRLQEQSVRAQKFATLSAVSAGIAHEIRQPLNSIKVLADGILYWHKRGRPLDNNKVIEGLQKISAQVTRIDEIIKYIRSFAKTEHAAPTEPCSLNNVAGVATEVLGRELSSHNIDVKLELSQDLPPVLGNANRLEEIVINLLVNAMQALDTVSEREKEIACRTGQAGKTVFLEVSDNATGISEEIMDKIFEPFFSAKQTGAGMGLGLSIAQTIVTSFNGKIEAINNEKAGATFRISFPAV